MTSPGEERRPLVSNLFREAVLNIASGGVRVWACVILSAACGLGVVISTAQDVRAIVNQDQSQVARGVDLFTISSQRGVVSAAKCEQFQHLGGVAAAGGIVSGDVVTPLISPHSSIQISYVTPGYLHAMFPDISYRVSVLAGNLISKNLGLRIGSDIDVQRNLAGVKSRMTLHVDAIAPAISRAQGLGSIIFVTRPPIGSLPSCLVRAERGDLDQTMNLVHAYFGQAANPSPFVYVNQLEVSPRIELANRVSHLVWPISVFLLVLAVLLVWSSRRRDYALYRLIGFPLPSLVCIVTLEVAVSVVLPLVYGAVIALVFVSPNLSDIAWRAVLADTSRNLLACALLPAAAAATALSGSANNSLKGK